MGAVHPIFSGVDFFFFFFFCLLVRHLKLRQRRNAPAEGWHNQLFFVLTLYQNQPKGYNLSGVDFKIMKVCTIILFIIMTLALKVLVLSTISMGTLFLESVIFINGWMPAHMALVTAAAIFLINIKKIKNKFLRLILYFAQPLNQVLTSLLSLLFPNCKQKAMTSAF